MTTLSKDLSKDDFHRLARGDFYTFVRIMFPVLYAAPFIDATYIRLLSATLQEVYSEPGRNQIINMPPRHLKSFIASICFPAWLLGRQPSLSIMIACHTLSLSKEHLTGLRKLMRSEEYQAIFGTRIGDKDTEAEFKTTEGGGALAATFETAPTGRGCDHLIVDDPIKADDALSPEALVKCLDFFRDALSSRVNNPATGSKIVVMQRLAVADLTGRLMNLGGYHLLSLPLEAIEHETIPYKILTRTQTFSRAPGEVLNPARMTPEVVEQMKAQLPDTTFAAQYQQRPMADGGTIVKRDQLRFVEYFEPGPGAVVMSCDMASTTDESSSYTVFQVWRFTPDEIFELHDLRRFRIPPERAGAEALLFAQTYKPHIVLVEDMNAGLLVADTLKRAGLCVDTIHPTQSKEQRLLRCLAAFHSMKVRLPREAPWLEDFLAELLAFPGSRHDDQVDATSQALNFAIRYFQGEIKIKGFSPNGHHIARTRHQPKDHPMRPRPSIRGPRRW